VAGTENEHTVGKGHSDGYARVAAEKLEDLADENDIHVGKSWQTWNKDTRIWNLVSFVK
jgi:hypothetical protein